MAGAPVGGPGRVRGGRHCQFMITMITLAARHPRAFLEQERARWSYAHRGGGPILQGASLRRHMLSSIPQAPANS